MAKFPIIRNGIPLLTEDGASGPTRGGNPKLTYFSTDGEVPDECCCVVNEPTACCCEEFLPPNPAPVTLTATIVGCGGISSGTIPMSGAVIITCLDYTGSNAVGNCGSSVSLGATLTCNLTYPDPGTCEDLTLEIRRTTPNCLVNGGAAQTVSASSGCSCDPFSATFAGYGGVDDSGSAPGSCDCCPGGTFDVIVTE